MIPNMDSARDRAHLVTADGRKGNSVEVVPNATIWRWRVTVGDKSYCVNGNGRRYANVQSKDDVLRDWPYDVMAPVLEVINAVASHNYHRARSLNGATYIEQHLNERGITQSIPHPSHLQ